MSHTILDVVQKEVPGHHYYHSGPGPVPARHIHRLDII